MKFTTSGQQSNPSVLLIHPMLNNATCFDDFEVRLRDKYYVIRPTLDGHDGESDFTTLDEQILKIVQYLIDHGHTQLDFILGTSLGALVAFGVSNHPSIKAKRVFMEGTPFFNFGKFVKSLYEIIYLKIWNNCRANPEGAVKKFASLFPESAERMVHIASSMSKTSVENLPDACYSNKVIALSKEKQTQLHFFFGSKELAKLSIRRIKKLGAVEIRIFKGFGHCEYLEKHPGEYLDIICNQ